MSTKEIKRVAIMTTGISNYDIAKIMANHNGLATH